ncbi:MAG: SDR family oxidoreductase [Actinomycetota bacterium]
MDPILVTGGTGTLGRHVVRRLREKGHEVRVLTRGTRDDEDGVRFVTGDLLTERGIGSAVEGVGTIVHAAGSNKGDEVATRHLVDAAPRAGRPHVVYISVVGADRVPVRSRVDRLMFSYFDMKRKAEDVVARSGLPWTTIRATQFHDLVLKVAETMAKLPVVPVPSGTAFQPVDADEVAAAVVELALSEPAGLAPDIMGPRVYPTAELIRAYLSATHRRRPLVPLPLPGEAARAIRSGANLAPDRAVGTVTWDQFLADHVAATAHEPERA